MAPLKNEEQMRQKLEQRRINPSEGAWEKLSQKLDAESGRSKGFPFWWLGIAAGFIGVLLIVTVMVRSEDPIEEQQVVIEEEISTPMESETSEGENADIIVPQEDDKEKVNNTDGKNESQTNEKSILSKKLRNEKAKLIREKTREVLAQANGDEKIKDEDQLIKEDIKVLNKEKEFISPGKIFAAMEGNATEPILKQFGSHETRGDFLIKVKNR